MVDGPGRVVFENFAERAAAISIPDRGAVVDLGCGGGEMLAAVAGRRTIEAIGIDLSQAAIERAARTFPAITWVIANADRRLPLVDRRVSLVLSLHARRNPAECARVLTSEGRLLVAVPAEDDLAELRAAVQGAAVRRDRGETLIAEHDQWFRLLDRSAVRQVVEATRPQQIDLLAGTYRGARHRELERAEKLESMKVTIATEIFLFALRRPT